MFGFITLLSLVLLIGLLCNHRHRTLSESHSSPEEKNGFLKFTGTCLSRMPDRLGAWRKKSSRARMSSYLGSSEKIRYPFLQETSLRIVIYCFVLLAFTGFVSAIFLPGGLQGYFMLIHFLAGGMFALAVAPLLILQAGNHLRVIDTGPLGNLRIFTGWGFALSSFCIVLSAFFLLLPSFSQRDILWITAVHRYAALAALLAAIGYRYSLKPLGKGP